MIYVIVGYLVNFDKKVDKMGILEMSKIKIEIYIIKLEVA